MSTAKAKQLQVKWAPDVKERLMRDAEEQAASFNDVAVGILAAHFGVAFVGTGRPSRGGGEHRTSAGQLPLRVPARLYAKVHAAAMSRSKTAVVDAVIREFYSLHRSDVLDAA